MKKPDQFRLLYSSPAILWDGFRQLSGILELHEDIIHFQLHDFAFSHLSLVIPLVEIDLVEEYLIFDLAKNGLLILNKNGNRELFVMTNGPAFLRKLRSQLAMIRP